jgi:hypothetical protein
LFGTQIGAQLAASWLYDRIKARKGGWLEIEGIRIELDKGEIERVLIDKLTTSPDTD